MDLHGLTTSYSMQSAAATAAAVPAESALTGYLWFPEETELWLLQAALQLLRPLTPLPFSRMSSKAAVQAPPQGPPQSPGEGFCHDAAALGAVCCDIVACALSSGNCTNMGKRPCQLGRPRYFSLGTTLTSLTDAGGAASIGEAQGPNSVVCPLLLALLPLNCARCMQPLLVGSMQHVRHRAT